MLRCIMMYWQFSESFLPEINKNVQSFWGLVIERPLFVHQNDPLKVSRRCFLQTQKFFAEEITLPKPNIVFNRPFASKWKRSSSNHPFYQVRSAVSFLEGFLIIWDPNVAPPEVDMGETAPVRLAFASNSGWQLKWRRIQIWYTSWRCWKIMFQPLNGWWL